MNRITQKEKTGKMLTGGKKRRLEVCRIDGACNRVAKELLHFGKDRRLCLYGGLIAE